jgi:hypothetical protein
MSGDVTRGQSDVLRETSLKIKVRVRTYPASHHDEAQTRLSSGVNRCCSSTGRAYAARSALRFLPPHDSDLRS